ncbi:uncharacterized protein LOC136095758 [Hydra vulgaris]|uniref:uncharacterized protein LOC136095758 n=1 Tax=Hydra vulgaris TaxID=6087 RepID=UPI0032EA8460
MSEDSPIATRKRSHPSTSSSSAWRARRAAVLNMSEVPQNPNFLDLSSIKNDIIQNKNKEYTSSDDASSCNTQNANAIYSTPDEVASDNDMFENLLQSGTKSLYDDLLCSKLRDCPLKNSCTQTYFLFSPIKRLYSVVTMNENGVAKKCIVPLHWVNELDQIVYWPPQGKNRFTTTQASG